MSESVTPSGISLKIETAVYLSARSAAHARPACSPGASSGRREREWPAPNLPLPVKPRPSGVQLSRALEPVRRDAPKPLGLIGGGSWLTEKPSVTASATTGPSQFRRFG